MFFFRFLESVGNFSKSYGFIPKYKRFLGYNIFIKYKFFLSVIFYNFFILHYLHFVCCMTLDFDLAVLLHSNCV